MRIKTKMLRREFILFFIIFFLKTILVFSASIDINIIKKTYFDSVESFKLENGLKVVLIKKNSAPIVSCRIIYKVGSRFEETGYTGISHMLEHMMFKGTKKLGTKDYKLDSLVWVKIDSLYPLMMNFLENSDSLMYKRVKNEYDSLMNINNKIAIKNHYFLLMDKEGAQDVNAYTTKDGTFYFATLPKNKLELFFATESDRMINSTFREFYTERSVVREERRRRYENRPRGMAWEKLIAYSYISHPYRNPVIGWGDDIENYTIDYLRSYYKKYYAPNNAILVVVGDIDFNKTKKLINKYFSHIPSSHIERRHITKESIHHEERRIKLDVKAEPFVYLSYNIYKNSVKDNVILDLIETILSGGNSSLIYRELIKKKKIVVSGDAFYYTLKDPGLFVFTFTPSENIKVDSVIVELDSLLCRIKSGKIDDYQIGRAKNVMYNYYIRQFEGFSSMNSLVGWYELIYEDWRYILKYLEILDSITKDDIIKKANEVFKKENRTIVYVE